MQVGDDFVIIGVRGIGLLCLVVVRAAGAGRLITIDSSLYALTSAQKLGATHVIDLQEGDARKQVCDIIPVSKGVWVPFLAPTRLQCSGPFA